MLSKEECEKALEICKAVDREFFHCYTLENLYDNKGHKNVVECFEQLIKEHFELVDKHTSKENKFLQLEVVDKETNKRHVVGTKSYDCLLVENGKVVYYDLRDFTSTDDYYEFREKWYSGK